MYEPAYLPPNAEEQDFIQAYENVREKYKGGSPHLHYSDDSSLTATRWHTRCLCLCVCGGEGLYQVSPGITDSAQVQTCDCLHTHLAVPLNPSAAVCVCVWECVCVCAWKIGTELHLSTAECFIDRSTCSLSLLHDASVSVCCQSSMDSQQWPTLICDRSSNPASLTSDRTDTERGV